MNLNLNGQDRYRETNQNRTMTNPAMYAHRQQQQQQQQQHEASLRSMAIEEMMERARLAAANGTRPRSPAMATSGMLPRPFMDAMPRSDRILTVDSHVDSSSASPPPPTSSQSDAMVSPSSSSSRYPKQNRPAKHYPRPPLLNTWQGRAPGYDEFAGLMTDREKQWVVKIQLHQASQTQDEVRRHGIPHADLIDLFSS